MNNLERVLRHAFFLIRIENDKLTGTGTPHMTGRMSSDLCQTIRPCSPVCLTGCSGVQGHKKSSSRASYWGRIYGLQLCLRLRQHLPLCGFLQLFQSVSYVGLNKRGNQTCLFDSRPKTFELVRNYRLWQAEKKSLQPWHHIKGTRKKMARVTWLPSHSDTSATGRKTRLKI